MHVLVLCIAIFRSRGELTVLKQFSIKRHMCVASSLFIHVITQIIIIQGRLQLLNKNEHQCIFLLTLSLQSPRYGVKP
jgi:putative copper export protein